MIGRAPQGFVEVEARTLSSEVRKVAGETTRASPREMFWVTTEDGSEVIVRLVQGIVRYYRKNKCKKVRIYTESKEVNQKRYRWKRSELRECMMPVSEKLNPFSSFFIRDTDILTDYQYTLTPLGTALLEDVKKRCKESESSDQMDRDSNLDTESGVNNTPCCDQNGTDIAVSTQYSAADQEQEDKAGNEMTPSPDTSGPHGFASTHTLPHITHCLTSSLISLRSILADALPGKYDGAIKDPLLMVAEDVFIRLLLWPER